MDQEIFRFVKKVRLRLAGREIMDKLQTALPVGIFAALLLSLVSLLVPFYYALHAAVLAVVLSVPAGILAGILHTPDMMNAALAADAKGHRERISTALFLADSDQPLADLQKRDALSSIAGFQVRKEFPFQWSKRRLALTALLAALFGASCFLDTEPRQRAAEAHAQKERVEEVIAQVERVEDELKENKELTDAERTELEEQLRMSKENLTKAETAKELLKEQERLAQKLTDAADKTQHEALAQALKNAANSSRSMQEKTRREMVQQARDALAQAQNGSEADKNQAYEKLSELAAALGDDALQAAADHYRDVNYAGSGLAAAHSALNQASDRLDGSYAMAGSADAGDGKEPNANASVSAAGASGMTGDGQGNSNSANSGANGQSGNSSGQGPNSNSESSGSGNGTGNGNASGSGNGAGNGSSSGNGAGNGSGSGSGMGGGWNYGSKDGGEAAARLDETITVPEGELGDDENLTGEANGNDSSMYASSDQSLAWAGSKVSYGSVSGAYKQKAYQKLDGASYPDRLKDQIRDYFAGLN